MRIRLNLILGIVLLQCSLSIQQLFGQNVEREFPLMPWPEKITFQDGKYLIDRNLGISVKGPSTERLTSGVFRFLSRLDNRTGLMIPYKESLVSRESANPDLRIEYQREGKVGIWEVESYQLKISDDGIQLRAETDIGIIRGLQTLFQLLGNDAENYHFPYVDIEDNPRFKWRGLMIDASRHFQPMEVLKRNMDGMEAVKLNVLHLHLSDDHGFRVESKKFPKLTGAASDGLYYTREQIGEIIRYADERGITVVPEIDVPGHASAILTAYTELASKDSTYQLVRNAGVFNATLNPILPETYEFLDVLFGELTPLFPDPYFHIGGDENEGLHWTESAEIQKFMRKNDIKDNHMLQAHFNRKVQAILEKYGKKMMGWEEIHVEGLDRSATVHAWRGENEGFELRQSLFNAVKDGYNAVLSDGYYIDRMNSVESHYKVDPLPQNHGLSEEEVDRILGAETTMWSELVTPLTIDSRIWPRVAAIAERYWSPSEVQDVASMYSRLEQVTYLLEYYGLTHIRNKDLILRNMCGGQDTEALRTLVNAIEPLKGYSRNPNGTLYDTFSPFTLLADAASTDAIDARKFRQHTKVYLADGAKTAESKMRFYLNLWRDNHDQLVKTVKPSPIMKEALMLSQNLSTIAVKGIEALDYFQKNQSPADHWFVDANQIIERSKEQSGRTELQVVEPIEWLISSLQTKAGVIENNQE